MYSGVLAVPVQWLPKLANFCRENSRKGYRPLRGNPNGVMCHVTTMFSRSINEQDIEGLFRDHLAIDVQGANVVQTWYPPIWRPTPSFVVRTTRPMLDAGRKTLDVAVDEAGNARIEALYPEFADRFGPKQRWANVIRLRDWQNEGRIATVFPVDVRKRAVPGFHVGSGHLVSTTEGLTLYPQFKDLPSHLKLIDGNAAITAWLKEQKVQATISESGKATHQIIQTMGGIRGVGSLAQKGILTVLNDMARRPITHAFQHQKFVNLIKTAVENDIWRPRNWERLVERKVVELGYELKCPRCDSWSWHALNALGHQITCDLCLKAFNFPVVEPTKSDHARWAYRVIGPFALPDYASGGYAASLALRFLGHDNGLSGPEITWAGGHELTFEDQSKLEADFIVWHQQKDSFRPDHPTEVVFGEAKSFGRDAFETRDLNRMKSLAMRFPGSILVLATLREVDELSTGEIAGIKKLAEWGRAYDREHRHSRAPLVLLTGTELFAVHSLDMAWKDKGGAREQLVAPAYVDTSRLRVVADLTQQAYLSLPPYDEWQRQRWENKRKQKAQHG